TPTSTLLPYTTLFRSLAWDCHALATNPAGLFHANDFYPAPYSLALSEHMLGNVPLFCPVYAVTGNPVLAHQIALLATFLIATLRSEEHTSELQSLRQL